MEVDFADFVHDVFALEGDETKAPVTVRLFIKHEHSIFDLK